MSGSIDILHPEQPKRVLMVVANPATSPVTGWRVGFWASEMTHPYYEFSERGYKVTLASPDGGKVEVDTYSDPRDPSEYSTSDLISMGFLHTPKLAALLETTPSVASFTPADFDAIFVCGGQSPMITMIDHAPLRCLFADFYAAGKVAAAVCHGTCILLKTTLSDGSLLVKGKTWTGFANSEEIFADAFVERKAQPFWIEDEAKKIPDTNFIVSGRFKAFATRDGNLITGQQQFSGAAAARLVIEALGV